MLLGRPNPYGPETVNDKDGFVANFWRALKTDPEQVALHATNPVNECDLHARNSYLLNHKEEHVARLMGDPDYYDEKIAGWWAWGASCWIGSGFCSGNGAWRSIDGKLVKCEPGSGNNKQLPHLGSNGRGVTRKLPHLGSNGMGVTRKLPHLGDNGRGPFDPSCGLVNWFAELAQRLRTVRIACGEWDRVLGPTVTTGHGLTAVFLDPPYAHGLRAGNIYATDDDVTPQVEKWCVENGNNPLLRIALCGYEEYELPGWSQHRYSAHGGYANVGNGRGKDNAKKECIWFSPNCITGVLF